MRVNIENLESLKPTSSELVGVDLSNSGSDMLDQILSDVLRSLNEYKVNEHRCVSVVVNVPSSNRFANVAYQSVRALASSASLEFANHGGRVNLVAVDESTDVRDLEICLDYLDDDSSGGFTTGNTLDIRSKVNRVTSGKKVLVTGGAGGLGYAAAKSFLSKGYQVILSDLPGQRLIEAGQQLGVEIIPADLGKESDISFLFDQLNESDDVRAVILHHGVGGATWLGEYFDYSVADRSIQVNGISFLKTLEELNTRELSKNLSIVCLSSIAGLVAEAGHSAYSAPKFAVVEMARVLRDELAAKGSTINVLCPGPIRTSLMEQAFAGLAKGMGMDPQEFTERRLSSIPLGDAGTTEQIGNSTVFLAETLATGIELAPTGGEVLV